jgi:undecaprenyl diphosphate synthase
MDNLNYKINCEEERIKNINLSNSQTVNTNNNDRNYKSKKNKQTNYPSKENSNDNLDFFSKDNLKNEFDKSLYGGYNCKPDILIRTSGEIRLSNFLLYQTRFSMLFFIDKFWPEITFMDYLKILIRYNYSYKNQVQKIKEIEKNNNIQLHLS